MKTVVNSEGNVRIVLSEREEAVLYEATGICGAISALAYGELAEWTPENTDTITNMHDVSARASSSQDELCELILELDGLSERERNSNGESPGETD